MLQNTGLKFFCLAFLLLIIFFGATSLPANAASLSYTNDANIILTTPSITLVIQAGSAADGLTVNATDIVVTLSTGETFILVSPQSLSSSTAGSGGSLSQTCSLGTETDAVTQSSGSETYTLTPTGSACAEHGSLGGGGAAVILPSVTLSIPNGGEVYAGGAQIGISWAAANGAYVSFRVSYSPDNGNTWSVLNTVPGTSSSYTWTVPAVSTTQGLIKIEGLGSSGSVLAIDTSNSTFKINGSTVAPPPIVPPSTNPPATDSTATGNYSPSVALANTTDINTDLGLTATSEISICATGALIKGSFPAVYYCGADGKRYVFTNSSVYFTWYMDFSGVQVISDADLASIPLGGNVTYRPGVKMVKIQTDPKVYAVSRGGLLHWLSSEEVARRLYGADWNKKIDYIPDAFFVNYRLGDPITE